MAIQWLRYPVDVKQSVRIIPVQVQLPAGSVVTNLQVVAGLTSSNVSLYTENGVVVSRTISVPLNQHEVYLSVSTIDDHDTFVSGQIDPEAKQSVAVALRESVSNEQAFPIYIKVGLVPDDTVTTEKTQFSDNFNGVAVDHELWTVARHIGGASASPTVTIGGGLVLTNLDSVARDSNFVRSDIVQGRCHVEFRGVIESARQARSDYYCGVGFVNEDADPPLSADPYEKGGLQFLILGTDPATTIHCYHASTSTSGWTDIPVVLSGGGLTTGTHTYTIDFDGHVAIFSIDGVQVVRATVNIPRSDSKLYGVYLCSVTGNPAPAATTTLTCRRVDVASDERLVTAAGAGGSAGSTTTVVDATPSAPTHGVTTAVATDNSTLVATVQVGKRYRISVVGGDGTVWTNSAGPAARATDEPMWGMMAREFIAVHVSVYCQKLLIGSANSSVLVVPLDGGTIA